MVKVRKNPLSSDKNFLLFRAMLGHLPVLIYFVPLIVFTVLGKIYITTRYRHLIPSLLQYFLIGTVSFILVLIFTPLCMKIARRFNIVAKVDGRRSKGFIPVPLLGGTGIYLSFLIVALYHQPWAHEIQAIAVASSIIFIIGTMDDIRPLSSIARLLGQLLAAGIVIGAGLRISFMPHTWWGECLAILMTLIWILGIINATNFIDGVDGLAAGFTVIASMFFFLITLHLQEFGVALISIILVGCGLGFLVFNFKPAKIYLGDGGSTFMGFLLACLALYGQWSHWGPIIACGIPVLILSVLIFDMIYITISRIRNGHVRNFRQWLDYRGQDHFHHRLIHLGFKEEEAVVFIYSTSIILGLSALVIENARVSYPVVVLLIQAVLIFINTTILMLTGRQMLINASDKK
ncbi:MAG: undecaprenyl/decaprenyl-phosphate alpha-N-acetylglucosaminyl 1-phosphate transferase [Candidatus Omnitrophica bacterium]|nr:undecaprenyl/decaprenyl-phosphate alpha-N-acetylglucosaminyl 1-phosphate transferase [Candidatus Omnitrophota bacterium]